MDSTPHSPETRREVLRRAAHESIRAIARDTGIATGTISRWIRADTGGLKSGPGAPVRALDEGCVRQQASELRRTGARMDQIAEALGYSPRRVGRLIGHMRRGEAGDAPGWKPPALGQARWEEFQRRYQTAEPVSAILADFGISSTTGSLWARRARLPRKPGSGMGQAWIS